MTTDDEKVPASDAEVLLSALVEEAGARAGEHPPIEAFVGYLAGDLEAKAEARVQDHLVACRECAATLLDLEPLTRPDAAPLEGVADLVLAQAWREQRAKTSAAESRDRAAASRRWLVAIAASMAITAVGLTFWVHRLQQSNADLQRQVSDLSQPLVNMPLFYIGETTRSAREELVVVEVPAEANHFVLILTPAELRSFAEYEVQFTSSEGREAWLSGGLVLSDSGGLRLGLPRGFLPAGEYRIRLRARAGETWVALAEYRCRILYLEG